MPPPSYPPSEASPGAFVDGSILAVVIASVSSFVFIVAILLLLLLLYQRDPQCCQLLRSCRFFQNPSQYDCPPPYLSHRQSLGGSHAGAQPADRTAETSRTQGSEPFCVGPPHGYQLRPWQPPRLPSYESIRKKDRQRHVHQLIARRFGLWARGEMPPTYEESLRAEVRGQGAVAFAGPRNTAV